MSKRGWVSYKEFPGDSDERRDFALNLKEGLTPQGVFEDWGDYDNDTPTISMTRLTTKPMSVQKTDSAFLVPMKYKRTMISPTALTLTFNS